jgi:glycosyltransferase involved in cell wall biosynthesis
MVVRPPLSAMVITLNEELNLARCLKSLSWAEEILVVDSGSTDRTCEIAKQYGATVVHNPWRGYGQQKNFGLSQVKNSWVLSVDADEEVSSALREEILQFLLSDGKVGGTQYWGADLPRKTWYLGRWIMHGGWYPNRLVRLTHKEHSHWTEPEVHEQLQVKGSVYSLQQDLLHYTFRDVGDQVTTNIRFSRLGAKVAKQRGESGSIFKILFKPVGKFLETYFWKLGLLDGLPGLVISINAAHSIFMKYVELRFEKNSAHR